MRYRKKPVVIEAWPVALLLRQYEVDHLTMPHAIQEAEIQGMVSFSPTGVNIRTLEGIMFGGRGDMIIRGVQGELYPCKGDIFERTYDLAGD